MSGQWKQLVELILPARRGIRAPLRVQRELEREQYRSELLVTVVQLAIVGTLAALHAGAPPDFSPDAPIMAAPLGLTLFAVLALLRLYFALTGQLTRWLLACTVVGEMAVLLFTIWACHLQYEQPPQFSLKSTEFTFVFILIALRALRFEPAWVILSGLTAFGGWLAILRYAITHAPANPVTHDYVTSLRSIQIYYGGEFEKLLAVLMVTAVLALALYRARELLAKAVSGEQAVADLSLFFDDSVARRITQSEGEIMAGQGELREAAILFLDMRGFTEAAAALSPDEVIGLLGEYQGLLVPIIKAHGGSIDKFLGDGILTSFGAVARRPDYAAAALRCVDAIMDAVDGWREQRRRAGKCAPDVGAALACGEVVFGIIGERSRLEYTVIGDAVNLAAKLEKHNKVERTRALTTLAAYELAKAQGYGMVKTVLSARTVAGQTVDLVVAAPLAATEMQERLAGHVRQT
ncbi:adenylate/guanylate cyclase domain-containing protein [Massilia horti]|uniref:Adenylate/guanylate cyclase domain-containing protein n=1 Tax=Massilia horti TaxID=2562153 RepID=A0A4Y9T6D5_9BURK|nr:adenylate/guanylate cyclase domain-containing protein [Massilia horti]TFW32938.1 adenylate/guanylate cyclase domain-containing protein [Massilia horti]